MTSEHAGPRALRKLVEAVLSISADLDLSAVLQRIIGWGDRGRMGGPRLP